MKNVVNWMGIAVAAILFGAVLVSAQGPRPGRGMRMYDPATETTLKGTIGAVTQGARGMRMGVHQHR